MDICSWCFNIFVYGIQYIIEVKTDKSAIGITYSIICYILIILGICIYLEVFIINVCKMDNNTEININQRGEEEEENTYYYLLL